MYNVLPDEVDVTEYVNHGYKPVYCNGSIDKLINPKPFIITESDKLQLKKSVSAWATEHSITDTVIELKDIKYTYSYCIDYYPIDVFTMNTVYADTTIQVYFRKDKIKLIPGIHKEGWVVNSCE